MKRPATPMPPDVREALIELLAAALVADVRKATGETPREIARHDRKPVKSEVAIATARSHPREVRNERWEGAKDSAGRNRGGLGRHSGHDRL